MSLRTGFTAAASVVLLAGVLVMSGGRTHAAQGDRQKFVGTYRLVVTEVKDASGNWVRNPSFNSTGYITYDESDYLGVHIMPRDRPRFAAATQSSAEPQTAIPG